MNKRLLRHCQAALLKSLTGDLNKYTKKVCSLVHIKQFNLTTGLKKPYVRLHTEK